MNSDTQSPNYDFGKFHVDATRRLLLRDNNEIIQLTPKVFDTLLYLLKNSGKIIEKDELMAEIWPDTIVEENNLNKNISVLRGVLGEKPGEHRFIVTVPGHGYKFVAEVVAVAPESKIRISQAVSPAETAHEPTNATADPLMATTARSGRKKFAFAGLVFFILACLALYVWRSTTKPLSDPIKTIAVLPFKSLNAENRNEALEMGMADTLISKLNGGEEISVRPLSSVRRFGALEQDSLSAGRELGVEAVLDGSIQISGERVRVSAKLLGVKDGKQLWAEQFDEKFSDIFTVQDAISARVATALKIRLAGKDKKRYTENVEAYQLYMKGRFYLLKGIGRAETELSVSYFQQAIDADPNYALAYAGLADAYRGRSVGGEMPSAEFMPKAKAAAIKAIEIDDTLAEAHANLGHIMFWYDWDWNGAEDQHKRALELDPNSPDTLQFYAHLLSNTGRHAEALAKIKRARELDPLNLRINALEGLFLLHAGQTDLAIASLQKTLEMDPNFRLANMFEARAYIEKGLFAEAIAATRKSREISADSSEPITYGAYALAKSGKIAEARAALDEMMGLSKTRWVPPYNFALVHNALGESDIALDYLEKGIAEKDVRMVWLKVEPKWNNLRSEPRFIDLMKRMKLE